VLKKLIVEPVGFINSNPLEIRRIGQRDWVFSEFE